MGKSTISIAIFNSYVCLPEGSINMYQLYIVVIGSLESYRRLYRRLLPDIVRFALFCLWFQNIGRDYSHIICSYGHLSVISTYNSIYRLYNPIYNQL